MRLGDAGIHDLLLHERDRAFTVSEVAELVTDSGLRLVTFIDAQRVEAAGAFGNLELMDLVGHVQNPFSLPAGTRPSSLSASRTMCSSATASASKASARRRS